MKNLFNEIFTDLFGTEEEFYDHLKETFKSLDEGKSEKDEKDEDVKSYGYYDKKVYKNNKLYDHLEKKYENGKCYSLKHNPNHGVTDELPCCEKKCVENKCEHEQQKTVRCRPRSRRMSA